MERHFRKENVIKENKNTEH